jgi:tetratricopeptide (TPR) repeat protein
LHQFSVNRVNSFRALNRLKRVIAEYSEAIRLDPDNALAYCARATALGKYDLSIPDACEAIRLDPELYLGYDARGFGHLQCGRSTGKRADYEQSYSDFTEALRLKSTAADCQQGRAMAYQGLQSARQ